MKSRDLFLPSFTSIVLAGMVAFLSCAHQNRTEDSDMPADTGVTAENTASPDSTSSESPAPSEETEKSSDLTTLSEEKPKEETGTDALAQNNEGGLDSKESTGLQNDLDSQSNATAVEPHSEKDTLASDSIDKTPLANDKLETQLESSPQASGGLDSASGLNEGGSSLESSASGVAASSSALDSQQETPAPSTEAKNDVTEGKAVIAAEPPPVSQETLQIDKPKAPRKAHSSVAFGKLPKIPAKAITKRGVKLNRFYFVRQGDTPESVSQLLYGSADQAKPLVQWNGAHWEPGKLVFYSSHVNPADPKMDSFYKENGVQAEEYALGRGEWLSKVAHNKLGSSKSWTEIAVINGIKNPQKLEVGQKIALYPRDLLMKPQPEVMAKAETPPPVEAKPVQPAPPPPAPPVEQVKPAEPEPVAPPVITVPAKPPVAAAPAGFNLQKLIEQNMFAALMGLAGFFLVLLLIVKKNNRKRAAAQEDFGDGEEGFQPPTKLKRK